MDPSALVGLAGQFLQWGALGGVAVALMTGFLVPSWVYKRADRDADRWRQLFETEQAAHEHTRAAYALQGERLQIAVESAKVTEQLLREARASVVASQDGTARAVSPPG